MAYIGHRCDCGHSDLSHAGDDTGNTLGRCTAEFGASCSRDCGPVNQPEVIPTFNGKGRPVERVIEPGGGLPSESGNPVVKTCPCDACVAMHEQLAVSV
ncbi:hypothetical protein OHB14_36505 [Streptomyces sp. NBC_01613]|uniref:hypothetical protein n=1 Tax=Streptomyces sp. NBC_01613 TaxID=2975896 RepID=UPI00386F54D5